VLASAALTLGIFIVLPYLEMMSKPPDHGLRVRPVATTRLPPPPAPRPERGLPKKARPAKVPRPRLRETRKHLIPVSAALQLDAVLGDVGGDFDLSFRVASSSLLREVQEMIFELGDLDEPPQPLVRLRPIYPAHARLKRLEGGVVIEFVVGSDGRTRDLTVRSSYPGDVFVRSALRAIRRWRFRPGTKDGAPVPVRVQQKVSFRLEA